MTHRPIAFALLAVAAIALPAAAQLSNFPSDTQGWRVVGAPTQTHITTPLDSVPAAWSTVGNPVGGLRVPDLYARTWIAAPASYLGDRGDAQGQQITLDLLVRANDLSPQPAIALVGADRTLFFVQPMQTGVWRTVAAMLDPWEG